MRRRFLAAALPVSSAPCRSLPIRNVSAAFACALDMDRVSTRRTVHTPFTIGCGVAMRCRSQGRYIMFNQSTLHARDTAAGGQSYSLRDVLCVAAKVLLPYAVMACILLLAR
jgi:hypothetical protein